MGRVVDDPGVVVDEGDVVDEPLPLVLPSHGGATCPGVVVLDAPCLLRVVPDDDGSLRAVVPSCVVDEVPLPLFVVLPFALLVVLDPWPERVVPDVVEPELPDVDEPDADEPAAGVHGGVVVDDGCPCDVLEGRCCDPFEFCAAAYPPSDSVDANASALIIVM